MDNTQVQVNQADLQRLIAENTELKTIVSKQVDVLHFIKTNVLNGKLPSGDISLIEMVAIGKSVMQLVNKYKKNPEIFTVQLANVNFIATAGAKYLTTNQIKSLT